MLLGQLVDQIELMVYEGKPSDDVTLERAQIADLLSFYRDQLVKEHLDNLIKAGKGLESYYFEHFNSAQAQEESVAGVDDDDERLYITLPKQPMSLLNDRGVVKVTTNEGFIVLRSRLENIETIKNLRYAKPSPANMVWYRDNKTIVIEGLFWKNKDSATFETVYIPTYTSQHLTEADEFKISDEFLPILLTQVEDVAKRQIYGSQSDDNNDGVDPKTAKYAPQTAGK